MDYKEEIQHQQIAQPQKKKNQISVLPTQGIWATVLQLWLIFIQNGKIWQPFGCDDKPVIPIPMARPWAKRWHWIAQRTWFAHQASAFACSLESESLFLKHGFPKSSRRKYFAERTNLLVCVYNMHTQYFKSVFWSTINQKKFKKTRLCTRPNEVPWWSLPSNRPTPHKAGSCPDASGESWQ